MPEEFFDIVDDHDQVIGRSSRDEVHRRRLNHRAVHIFVFNSAGELLIHRRSANKDECPLLWTSSASGHVSAGESYDECAPREMKEEIGLDAPLERLHRFPASDETGREFTVLYQTATDAPPTFDPEEIAEGRFQSWESVRDWLNRCPDEFTPVFRILFRWYDENRNAGVES